jgi:hypothetical protein
MTQIHNEKLVRFANQAASLSREEFVEQFPVPFLIVDRETKGMDTKEYKTMEATDSAAGRKTDPGRPVRTEYGEQFISTLEKSIRNSFGNMVTVGRAPNNDVVIAHSSISKLHAYFREDRAKQKWTLTDTGSTNGTFMTGQSLPANEPVPLESGQAVTFGGAVTGTFFESPDFFDYLEILRRAGKL